MKKRSCLLIALCLLMNLLASCARAEDARSYLDEAIKWTLVPPTLEVNGCLYDVANKM